MAQEATVPEMDKLLADTDHFTLRQSHVWDIAAYVYQKATLRVVFASDGEATFGQCQGVRVLFAMRLVMPGQGQWQACYNLLISCGC